MNTTNHALHVNFAQRNQLAFQRLLDSHRSNSSLSSSVPKSWSRLSALSSSSIDVNARDQYGRSVLHLACSATDPASLEYIRLLLAVPSINVNLQDKENNWSPLHRALYAANIPACVLLLQCIGIDLTLKDADGYTPFDLYHSVMPLVNMSLSGPTELYTWGANSNATLGHGDSGDRTYPEQIILRQSSNTSSPDTRVDIRHIAMAKLHSISLTNDPSDNIWICGFGSSGRLGSSVHTQFEFKPFLHGIPKASFVALGQDHTLAVSDNGDVYTWGLNRFSQLGYLPERTKGEEWVQLTPRKVSGPVKKELIIGAAACRTASACWSQNALYTWGTNSGQLGYDSTASPVQVLPRRVLFNSEASEFQVALTDTAMACLIAPGDVLCYHADAHFRINFSMPPLVQSFFAKRGSSKLSMSKVVASDGLFASLSSSGDVFTFSHPPSVEGSKVRDKPIPVKPQLLWSRRKEFSAVKDIALGCDGSLILCTASGDVYVRSRNNKGLGGKTYRFQHIPFIHRAIQVSANASGSYAVISSTHPPEHVSIQRTTMGHDFSRIQPYSDVNECQATEELEQSQSPQQDETDDAIHNELLSQHILLANRVVQRLFAIQSAAAESSPLPSFSRGGCDLVIDCGPTIFAHQIILLARCPGLLDIVKGGQVKQGSIVVSFRQRDNAPALLSVKGCRVLTILMLLSYVYSDEISPIWERSVALDARCHVSRLRNQVIGIKDELLALSTLLRLSTLRQSLEAASFTPPLPSLPQDMEHIYQTSHLDFLNDVRIHFADHTLNTHSTILRARAPYFSSFFDEDEWTKSRRPNGVLEVFLKHMRWRAASVAFAHICYHAHSSVAETVDPILVSSAEDPIDFYFEVLAIANELLLDHLALICTNAILQRVNFSNVGAVLCEASHLQIASLKVRLHEYIADNLEAILEFRLLDDMPSDILREVMSTTRDRQRTGPACQKWQSHVSSLLVKHQQWLDLQDLPVPLLPTARIVAVRSSPKLVPESPACSSLEQTVPQPLMLPPSSSPVISAARDNTNEGVFDMDDELAMLPALSNPLKSPALAWRTPESSSGVRHNFKAIMSETARQRGSAHHPASLLSRVPSTSSLLREDAPVKPSPEKASTVHAAKTPTSPARPKLTPTKSDNRLSLGPTFTPAKVSPSLQREISGSPKHAWSNATASPKLQPSSPERSNSSFIAIQEQQRQQQTIPHKGRTSLLEIQQQEAASQQEAEFLQWWEAEEEKIRLANEIKSDDGVPQRGKSKAGSTNRRRGRVKEGKDHRKVVQGGISVPGS